MKNFRFMNIIGIVAMMAVLAGFASCSKSERSTAQMASDTDAGEKKPAKAAQSSGKANPASDFKVAFNETEDGVVIEKYVGNGSKVVIPAEIEGLPVREIANRAFFENETITSVVIPNGVTIIRHGGLDSWDFDSAWGAFKDCTRLSSITIPDSVKEIGGWAFEGCSSLVSVTIPDNVTSISLRAFRDCSSLEKVILSPVEGRSWGGSAFSGCKLTLATQKLLREAGYTDGF
jgi:hypothetical protein